MEHVLNQCSHGEVHQEKKIVGYGVMQRTSLDHQCLIFCSGRVALLPGNVALPDLQLLETEKAQYI